MICRYGILDKSGTLSTHYRGFDRIHPNVIHISPLPAWPTVL